MTDTITWPELVKIASEGLASREPFDIATGDLLARGIVGMDAEMRGILEERRTFLPTSSRPPTLNPPDVVRCIMCGTAVTPGQLIGNTLANGAMPKMAEGAIKSLRLHTDETDQLRARVAELEAAGHVLAERARYGIDDDRKLAEFETAVAILGPTVGPTPEKTDRESRK